MVKAIAVSTLLCKDCKNPYSFNRSENNEYQYMSCATSSRYGKNGAACTQYKKRYKIPEIEIDIEEIGANEVIL